MVRRLPMNRWQGMKDRRARLRALDPSASFIVQAPAGSGKTELLMQRFLMLLARVEAPEEIIAITFTRKAAGEMRQRIIQALESARRRADPEKVHEQRTRELAGKALARDAEKGWHLLDNPARLRIQTIDSLCLALARQMPVLSGFGSVPAITENAQSLYREAARNTVLELESGGSWSDAVVHLVRCLDNRLDRLEELIATMLGHRDQWLRHIASPDEPRLERGKLEAAIARVVTSALRGLNKRFPRSQVPELVSVARFAAGHLPHESGSSIARCLDLAGLPGSGLKHRGQWEGIAELLLTQGGTWRARVTRDQGFPPQGDAASQGEKERFREMKQRMEALLQSLESEDTFRQQLALLSQLPPGTYADEDWATLQALVQLLRIASAHLELVFTERGQIDFTALAQAAIMALGGTDAPTDLALALDYRIQHLLVDEFQDTSFSHYRLLGHLTAGWQRGDGRTLFVVGDPMQSIYRFREAEVGLFFVARDRGIGPVPLEFLNLGVNFRSQQGIVDWINEHFGKVLPEHDSFNEGAVSFSNSVSFHPKLEAQAVTVCPSHEWDDTSEARKVVSIVEQARAESPHGTIAILVRARTHLEEITQQLRKAGHWFQAVEIDRLTNRPVIQDLLALTRALSHLHDRIAWLAVLRAPYCGLTLADLHALAGDRPDRTVMDLLHDEQLVEQLSQDGQSRIARVLPVLDTALQEQARCSVRNTVEGTWIALGGPACLPDRSGLENAEVFFRLLEEIGGEREVPDTAEFCEQVERLFALPDAQADGTLQLMTIHKAKGLEFDTVILPGLGRIPKHDEEKLLHWLEYGRESGGSELLLAPISPYGQEKGQLASYLKRLDGIKGNFEDGRLLYVAATRARRRLYLLGHARLQEQGGMQTGPRPLKNSLLACLWPAVEDSFQSDLAGQHDSAARMPETAVQPEIRTVPRARLALDWALPPPVQPVLAAGPAAGSSDDERKAIKFDWAGETAMHIGTVVHRLFQHIGSRGIEQVHPGELHRLEQAGYRMLKRLAVQKDQLGGAFEVVCSALRAVLDDDRGRWILSGTHRKAGTELALSCAEDGKIEHIIIDRTFVDQQGVRWIIDYKASSHGGKIDEFLDQEQKRYREQLERYARVMRKMEGNPIRLGLYFPLLNGWREWEFSAGSAGHSE